MCVGVGTLGQATVIIIPLHLTEKKTKITKKKFDYIIL